MTVESLGVDGYKTLKHPESIQVVRVEQNLNRSKYAQKKLVEFGSRQIVSGEAFETLSRAFVDRTLANTSLLLCGFRPDYLIIYTKDGREVNAVVCFSCRQTQLNGTEYGGYASPPFDRDFLSQFVSVKDRVDAEIYRSLGNVAVYSDLLKGDFQVESMVTNALSRENQEELATPSYDDVWRLLQEIPRAVRQRIEPSDTEESPVTPAYGKEWLAIQFSSKYRPRIVIHDTYLSIHDGRQSGGIAMSPRMISIVNEIYLRSRR